MVWTEIRGPQLLASLADFVGENWALLARIPLVVGPMEQETEDSWDDQRGIEVREPPDVVWGYKNEAGNEVPESRGYLRQVPMTAPQHMYEAAVGTQIAEQREVAAAVAYYLAEGYNERQQWS